MKQVSDNMTTNTDKRPANLGVVVIYLVCLSLLLGLGAWQVHRGFEKKQIENSLSEQQNRKISLNRRHKNWSEIQYKTVELEGYWLAGKAFLLDSRVYKGKLGYEWLNPLQLAGDGSVVLVNRGWVEKDQVGETMLGTDKPGVSEKISGQFYLPDKGFTLGPTLTNKKSWPKIIQYFDQSALSSALGVDLEPGIVVLDSNPDHGLIRIWSPYTINAVRHYGYALQWWGLALVLIIFGYIWGRNSNKNI